MRPALSATATRSARFQSTHPHRVRPSLTYLAVKIQHVSIHAPAWGATRDAGLNPYLMMFQSTHPHGVRLVQAIKANCVRSFNPRTRTGCDATFAVFGSISYWFQSTHPHGVRHCRKFRFQRNIVFQSTHPHGVRLNQNLFGADDNGFNPRTRTGCDRRNPRQGIADIVSIHAPARGATFY